MTKRMSKMSPNLPVIDITPFSTNAPAGQDSSAKRDVGAQLAEACSQHGVFYLKSGDIGRLTNEKRLRTFEAAKQFFALPEEVKKAVPISPGGFTRGYIGIGGESGSSALEVKEAFSYGYRWPDDKPPGNSLQGPNKWPDLSHLPPDWETTLHDFYAGMVEIATAVTRALSVSLGFPEDHFPSFCTQGDTISLMRFFHYFPYRAAGSVAGGEVERIGSSPHTDWGFLTLILQQDGVIGLQVADGEGGWKDVPPIPGTLIVNAGDYLALLTRGRVKSPLHRVITSEEERLSMVFFYYPVSVLPYRLMLQAPSTQQVESCRPTTHEFPL
ncbi:uncharacterized protein EV422DRAFT_545418 [Fimicolochytrium jonesii]|uniref:uncharacterized protein n=1 Tax=Fimicolochytrium jonesii TaxID=1396493 RepID=UPI0022FE6286|nr:uncharacterized protein EV422DRAFT_545418 [Fimicolochytrium jonesii]KAI8816486.1 hypothetical protein EV422DRAFT_545418 [Fimicolochytrium jonesii]